MDRIDIARLCHEVDRELFRGWGKGSHMAWDSLSPETQKTFFTSMFRPGGPDREEFEIMAPDDGEEASVREDRLLLVSTRVRVAKTIVSILEPLVWEAPTEPPPQAGPERCHPETLTAATEHKPDKPGKGPAMTPEVARLAVQLLAEYRRHAPDAPSEYRLVELAIEDAVDLAGTYTMLYENGWL